MFLDSSVRSIRTISLRSPRGRRQRRDVRLHVRGRGPLAQLPGVHAQRVHADGGGVAAVPHRPPGPVTSASSTSLAAVEERVRPPLGVEPGVIGAEHAVEHLAADVGRAGSRNSPAAPRSVAEVADRDVRPPVGEHPRDQRQVVVLHHRPHPRHGAAARHGPAPAARASANATL